jgi:hypothetical protein
MINILLSTEECITVCWLNTIHVQLSHFAHSLDTVFKETDLKKLLKPKITNFINLKEDMPCHAEKCDIYMLTQFSDWMVQLISYIKINCKKYTSLYESVFQHMILCL